MARETSKHMNHPLKHSILACALMQAFAAHGQTAGQTADQPVNEVVVTGNRFMALDRAGVGGFGDASLFETPASIVAIGRTRMQDLSIRSTTDAVRFDASVSDAYNAVGYAEQFSIRGFALDNNYNYRKDSFAIPGDTQIPLENKERIEILKGLAGLTAGIAAPGGIVNYVTKRPTDKPLRSSTVEVSERGTLYGTADIGGRFEDRRFGYRINAAAADLHSYVRGADGERQFVSGAFDWQITPDALLQLDMDYQHKAQITAPGYQLVRGEVLPTGVSAKTPATPTSACVSSTSWRRTGWPPCRPTSTGSSATTTPPSRMAAATRATAIIRATAPTATTTSTTTRAWASARARGACKPGCRAASTPARCAMR
jgi:iron complex outermembrane receptor protein